MPCLGRTQWEMNICRQKKNCRVFTSRIFATKRATRISKGKEHFFYPGGAYLRFLIKFFSNQKAHRASAYPRADSTASSEPVNESLP